MEGRGCGSAVGALHRVQPGPGRDRSRGHGGGAVGRFLRLGKLLHPHRCTARRRRHGAEPVAQLQEPRRQRLAGRRLVAGRALGHPPLRADHRSGRRQRRRQLRCGRPLLPGRPAPDPGLRHLRRQRRRVPHRDRLLRAHHLLWHRRHGAGVFRGRDQVGANSFLWQYSRLAPGSRRRCDGAALGPRRGRRPLRKHHDLPLRRRHHSQDLQDRPHRIRRQHGRRDRAAERGQVRLRDPAGHPDQLLRRLPAEHDRAPAAGRDLDRRRPSARVPACLRSQPCDRPVVAPEFD